jgi:hypothetical protein
MAPIPTRNLALAVQQWRYSAEVLTRFAPADSQLDEIALETSEIRFACA